MTQLEQVFRLELADKYPQYLHLLNKSVRIVKAKRDYRGGRSWDRWYFKGDLMLAFGEPKIAKVWNGKTRSFDKEITYIDIYSSHNKSVCCAPFNHFDVIEVVK